jgi:hypothetical protein
VDDIVQHDVRLQDQARRTAGIGQFLPDHGVVTVIETQPAMGLGRSGAQQARFPGGEPEGAIDNALFFPPVEIGSQMDGEELAHGVTEQREFVARGGPGLDRDHAGSWWGIRT